MAVPRDDPVRSMMEKKRWQRAQEIVQAALELRADERTAYLALELADDATLSEEVRSLLEAHGAVDRFLETPAFSSWSRWNQLEDGPTRAGQCIGPYKILRKIGEGGSGTVYLAVRDDDEYRRDVAIKMVDPRLSSRDALRRFRTERQILANFDHPNIARLYDGGISENGVLFLVMEYIEGCALDEFCDEQRLSIAERLRLLRRVCSAVQYAHQRLVVHRDLKPSNILVTVDGVPKLLDFGIAKLLAPESACEATRTGLRPLTPNYASPEQLLGGEITVASDVYSLGVVLYQLLTGRRPYHSADSLQELERNLSQEPPRPSRVVLSAPVPPPRAKSGSAEEPPPVPDPVAVSRRRRASPHQLSRQLAGDLDNVVSLALRVEPERRYASVEQLGEDLRRYEVGLPLLARQSGVGYRAGKFLRRHRLLAAAAVVILALVTGSLVSSVRHASAIARESDQVRAEQEKAEQVVSFLVDLLRGTDPHQARGTDPTVLSILDQESGDLLRRFVDQPVVRGRLLDTMGTIYQNRGFYVKARPLLEKGLELRRKALGEEHPEVAVSLTHLGILARDLGDHEAAESFHRRALAIRRQALGGEHPRVAESLHYLGVVSFARGAFDEAEQQYREALAMRRNFLGSEHAETAMSLNDLALTLYETGDYAAAEPLYREALDIARRRLGSGHPEVATMMNNLGSLLQMRGDIDGAVTFHRETLELRRRIFGAEHPMVAQSVNNLAVALRARGELEAAELLFREALKLARQFFGEEHHYVAQAMTNVAGIALESGEKREAEDLLRASVEMLGKVLPESHPDPAYPLIRLAGLLVERGAAAEAEPLLRQAVERRRRGLPPGHPLTAVAQSYLGGCLAALGRLDEAEPMLIEALEILEDQRGETHVDTVAARRRLAALYEARG